MRRASALSGLALLLACGSRSSLVDGRNPGVVTGGSGTSESGGGSPPGIGGAETGGVGPTSTGGTGLDSAGGTGNGGAETGGADGATCLDSLDLNAGPGEWTRPQRIEPAVVDGYSVTKPSIVTSTYGVSLAYTLSRAEGFDETNALTPGLVFSHKGTPLWPAAFRPGAEEFSVELVDPAAIQGGSIATVGGAFYISYRAQEGLKLATWSTGRWSTELVEPSLAPLTVAWSSQCRVDQDGTVHIVYDASGSIRHAVKAQGSWRVENLVSFGLPNPVESLDLELAPDGSLHVIWTESSGSGRMLRYAFLQNWWAFETVPIPGSTADAALDVSEEGVPNVVALRQSIAGTLPDYAQRGEDGWSFAALFPAPDLQGDGNISFELGPEGSSHLLLSALSSYYLTNESGAWEYAPVPLHADDGGTLVVDQTGAAHVVSRYFNFPQNVAPEYMTNRSVVPDGVDQNCDGVDGIDADGDGLASVWTGGEDCDDGDPSVGACAYVP